MPEIKFRTLSEIRQDVRELPYFFEQEVNDMLSTMMARFPHGSPTHESLLQAFGEIEAEIVRITANDKAEAYLASPDHARDLFAARQERGL